MKSFFYTKSQLLIQYLSQIEELRKTVLLVNLSPQYKNQLRWQVLNKRVNVFFHLANKTVNNKEVNQIRNSLNYIYQNWLASDEAITYSTIIDLYLKTFNGRLLITNKEIEEGLKYIQISSEHPIIQAALAKIIFLSLNTFSKDNEQFSDLVLTLFMYKYGYDLRRIVAYEEYFFKDKENYEEIIKSAIKKQNLTQWLEYFTSGLIKQLESTINEIKLKKVDKSNTFYLNDRQKKILFMFEEPNRKITNKVVMKEFKTSPVTAARDLAKLAKLNLILMVGKGRSTYYLKV